MADKYKLDIKIEKLNLYEIKKIMKLVFDKLAKNLEFDETEIKDTVNKHFKKL